MWLQPGVRMWLQPGVRMVTALAERHLLSDGVGAAQCVQPERRSEG